MMGILMTLLRAGPCRAQDLAEKYEVSLRTIYRDAEALAAAGIPIYTQPGQQGGIGILPSFTLQRTLLTAQERDFLLQLLRDFSKQGGEAAQLEEKLSAVFQQGQAPEWLRVDLRAGEGGSADKRFERCKQAIQSERLLHFAYRDAAGACSIRVIEPMTLLFRYGNWYIWGYCLQREDYRLFRLHRMSHACVLPGQFARRGLRFSAWEKQGHLRPSLSVQLLFAPEAASRVFDEFPPDQVRSLASGELYVSSVFPDENWALQALLTYGGSVFVLAPRSLQSALARLCAQSLAVHKRDYTTIWKEIITMENKTTNPQEMRFCQSCSMPLVQEADHGREADGAISEDYCHFCYQGGSFTNESISVDEMIEFCVPHVSNGNPYPDADSARRAMREYFPQLKRWKE